MKQTLHNLKDFVVHSPSSGGQVHLQARSREAALLTGAELLKEPLDDLSIYQPTDW